MKKAVIILVLILGIVNGAFSQNSGPMDLVLLLDTSASMSSSYQETSDYLIGPFLREFLRIGDTFHLISFSGTPRVELSRRIGASEDVEAVIGRLLLMYPLDPNTDLSAGLRFAEQYLSSLPVARSRKLVLVTDGDLSGTQELVNASTGRLRSQGMELQYIKVPVSGNGPSSGRPAAQGTLPQAAPAPTASSQTAPAAQTSQTTPPQTTQAAPAQTAPSSQTTAAPAPSSSAVRQDTPQQPEAPSSGQVSGTQDSQPSQTQQSQEAQEGAVPGPSSQGTPSSQSASDTQSSSQSAQGTSAAAGGAALQGASQGTGAQGAAGTAQSGTPPAQPQPVQSQTNQGGSSGSSFFSGDIPLPLLIALGILALLILALLIFFAIRRLHNSPNRVIAQAAAPAADYGDRVEANRQEQIKDAELMGSYAEARRSQPKPMPKDKVYVETAPEPGDGPLMLNLFVEDQNTAIGRRNIHVMKAGYTYSVGGGKSDFLIFLVPIPPHIADVQISGNNCTLIPRKSQYFPDIGSQAVSNCIGKTIRVLSDKRYELHIRMERYEDPLKALNKMLHSISAPG